MSKKQARKVRLFEGLPVIDGKTPIDLHVLPADVASARKKDPAHCAAAKAGQREYGTDVRVFLSRTYVRQGKQWVRYITPQAAQREIISFDRGSTFVPGTYTVKPPSEHERLGAHMDYSGTRSHVVTGTRPRVKRHTTGFIRERGKYDESLKGKAGR